MPYLPRSLRAALGSRRWLLAAAAWLAAAVTGRADALDQALARQAQPLLEKLYDKRCKAVGVLRFRCRRGDAETFYAGAINQNLATRLENALILNNNPLDPDGPIGVVRVASSEAVRKMGAWFEDEKERQKLFDLAFRPAWKGGPVKADGFLTGVVRVADDLKTAEVTVEWFTRASPKREFLHRFSVPTDPSLLRDLGYSFLVPEARLSREVRAARAAADARKRRGDRDDPDVETISPANTHGVRLEIYYNGEKQDVTWHKKSGEWRVRPPRAGDKVEITLEHLGEPDRPLGVLLRVNGLSTNEKEEADVDSCCLWLLGQGTRNRYKGFYMDDEGTCLPFKVLGEEESRELAAESGDKMGLIELDVFESRKDEPEEEASMTLRGLSQAKLEAKPAEDLPALQRRLAEARHPGRPKPGEDPPRRGLIIPAEVPVQTNPIETRPFPGRVHLGGIAIRYYTDPAFKPLIKLSK